VDVSVAEQDLLQDGRWSLVTRIVTSRHFAKAGQLRELLLYVARKAIVSPSSDITEQELGSRVLGRRPDYDPQEDTIVRVQMRHLRERLEKYFAAEGLAEPVGLSIPKGSYVPRFEGRSTPADAAALAELEPLPPRRWPRWPAVLAAGAILVAAVYLGRWSAGWPSQAAGEQSDLAANALFARLLTRDQPTGIVIADSSFVLIQDLLHVDVSLDDYIGRSYTKLIEAVPDAGLKAALRWASHRQYTSLADAALSSKFYSLGRRAGSKIAVRYARHLNIRDLNAGNFVLVGSRRGIPWVRLFEPHLNFRLEMAGTEVGFRNQQPLAGESGLYWSRPVDGPYETFATVALLPNLSGSGCVLLLNGLSMEASEAAGEFVLREDFPQTMARLVGADAGGKMRYFEVLLKIGTIAGAPGKAEVVAARRPKL
jgi:hypothetical protein